LITLHLSGGLFLLDVHAKRRRLPVGRFLPGDSGVHFHSLAKVSAALVVNCVRWAAEYVPECCRRINRNAGSWIFEQVRNLANSMVRREGAHPNLLRPPQNEARPEIVSGSDNSTDAGRGMIVLIHDRRLPLDRFHLYD
jgi:hypothetical protein